MRISDWSSDVCSSDLDAVDRYFSILGPALRKQIIRTPSELFNVLCTAPSIRPLGVTQIKWCYGLKDFLRTRLYPIKYHSKPHVFRFFNGPRCGESRTLCQYKIWSYYATWLPSGTASEDEEQIGRAQV